MYTNSVPALVSKNVGNALDIFTTWGTIIFNVKDYGAKGNGITDDTVAIQRAINAANKVGNATVWFPSDGIYVIGSKDAANVFLYWKSGVSFDGGGTIKIKGGVGDWRSIFEQSGTLSNVSMKNITIDSNTANNPLTQAAGNTVNTIRTEVFIQTGDNLLFDNVTIKNSVGVWSIITNAATNVTIQNCRFLNMGNAPFEYDTSCIYSGANYGVYANNLFVAAGKAVTTALEIHGKNNLISGNRVDGYRVGVILYDGTISENAIVSSNIFRNVTTGVSLWANDGTAKNITIINNDIGIDNLYFGAYGAEGILMTDTSSHIVDGLIIKNNIIRYNQSMSFQLRNGPFNSGIGINNTNHIRNLEISGNIIENPVQAGISIALNDTGILANAFIKNNTIINPGITGGYYKFGIVSTVVYSYDQVFIDNNIIRDDRATMIMEAGIATLATRVTTDNAAYGLFIRDNELIGSGTNYPGYVFGNRPFVKGKVKNWVRGTGFGNGAAYLSVIHDPNNQVTYTQLAADSGSMWRAVKYQSASTTPTVSFTSDYGDIVINTDANEGSPYQWVKFGAWLPKEQQGYRVYAGNPNTHVTPYYIGERLLDVTNNVWYSATSTLNSGWK